MRTNLCNSKDLESRWLFLHFVSSESNQGHLIEKNFKFIGIITVGNDMSQLFVSVVLSYYAGRGHKPRWMALGLYTVVLFCILTALPHFIYGPGEDALQLTEEYNSNYLKYKNLTSKYSTDMLCDESNTVVNQCENDTLRESNIIPQLILFVAQLISGVGGSLYYTLGVAYMDDNIKKSKTPALISLDHVVEIIPVKNFCNQQKTIFSGIITILKKEDLQYCFNRLEFLTKIIFFKVFRIF